VSALDPSRLFHTSIVVADIDQAMRELSQSLGLTWRGGWPARHQLHYLGADHDVELRIAFSAEGPHYIELIEAKEGTPWSPDGIGTHHVCYWSPDALVASAELEALGYTREVGRPGAPSGYFLSPIGLRVEVLTADYYQHLITWITRPPKSA
jgi:catechol 2,3-dioxygenase-like lactoylglutathione lyase family enzyme